MTKQDDSGYPYGEFDALKWAKEFKRLYPDSDEELMLGWFANAIMTGYDKAWNEVSRQQEYEAKRNDNSKATANK